MKAGVHVAGGSDAPVEAPTPLIGMADVTRRHQNGSPIGRWIFFFGGFLKSDSKKNIYHVFSQNLPKKRILMEEGSKKKSFLTIS